MPSEDPGQFPDLPTFAEDKFHEITSGGLREMIRRTVFATAAETARYSMTGVMWELDGSTAKLVATDGTARCARLCAELYSRHIVVVEAPANQGKGASLVLGASLARGRRIVADAKGFRTKEFRLKARWLFDQEGITIELL